MGRMTDAWIPVLPKFKLQSSPPQYFPLSLVEEFILHRPVLGDMEYSCASEYGVTFRSESYFQDPYLLVFSKDFP